MVSSRLIRISSCVCAIIVSLNAMAQHQEQLIALDSFIVKGIETWQPPGFAVTVVKDGEIVFTKAYGVRTVGTDNKVDENTLFGCMSTTKAFVAAGLAMLVDDGKLSWEDKVIDHLPNFQLKDPYVTREINIKDLLTHRTGIGNTDYLWSMMTISSDSALYKMREVDMTYSLRSGFIYQNLFYLAAGKVIEKVSGKPWDVFLKERIFDPLNMPNTYGTFGAIQHIENRSDAHYEFDGTIEKIEQLSADQIGPAGSIWSSIKDIGQWVKFWQNNAVVGNDTLISPKNFKELLTPQQVIPAQQFYPTRQFTQPNWMTYGLGWFQHDYRGRILNFHTGSLPGLVAIIGLLQEDNIGVYVMGNLDHAELRHAVMYTTFDVFIDGKITRDWSKKFYGLYHPETPEQPNEKKKEEKTESSLETSAYLGTYYDQTLGWFEISRTGDDLKFNMNDTVFGTIKHKQHDTFVVQFDRKYYGTGNVTFVLDGNGSVRYADFFGEQFHKRE